MGRLRDADGSATVFGSTERKVATPPEAVERAPAHENAQRQQPTSSKLTARQAAAGEMPSFMDVLQEDPNFHISHIDGSSFVYLVPRLGSMYDLAVADPLQVDPSACITLSKAGLTFSKPDGEIEFLSIDEFEREYFLYHTILKVREAAVNVFCVALRPIAVPAKSCHEFFCSCPFSASTKNGAFLLLGQSCFGSASFVQRAAVSSSGCLCCSPLPLRA